MEFGYKFGDLHILKFSINLLTINYYRDYLKINIDLIKFHKYY